jgi:hypothetical protein
MNRRSTVTPPLDHEPRRIRPPFNVSGSFDRVPDPPGETNDQWRQWVRNDRTDALLEALDAAGVELGAYDRRMIEWAAEVWDTGALGTIASWLYRAAESGRAER